MMRPIPTLLRQLRRNSSGLAAVEFALTAPIVLTMFLGGAEITNYTIVKLRISQIALHVSDNGSRIGTDSVLALKQISEKQINDLLTGADLQAGTLDMANHGRIVMYGLEPMASPNEGKFYVHWKRCFGGKIYSGSKTQGADNLTSIGPAGKQVSSVPVGGGVIFVEVAYDYQPLISARLVPTLELRDTAAMIVRDDRDFSGNSGTGVYNNENVTASGCTQAAAS